MTKSNEETKNIVPITDNFVECVKQLREVDKEEDYPKAMIFDILEGHFKASLHGASAGKGRAIPAKSDKGDIPLPPGPAPRHTCYQCKDTGLVSGIWNKERLSMACDLCAERLEKEV